MTIQRLHSFAACSTLTIQRLHYSAASNQYLKGVLIKKGDVVSNRDKGNAVDGRESQNSITQTNPAEVAAGYQVTPLAVDLVGDIETGKKTNESLIVDAAPKNNATPENRIAAQDALLEANWPVISNSIKFDPTGKVPQPFIKLAVQEMFRDIFPGRGVKAKFFDKFDPTLKTKATTFIDSQLKDRMPENSDATAGLLF